MRYFKINKARHDFNPIVSACLNDQEIVTLSTKQGNLIIMNENHYRSMMESLTLSMIPQMTDSLREGVSTAITDTKTLPWK